MTSLTPIPLPTRETEAPGLPPLGLMVLWRGHWIILACALVAGLLAGLYASRVAVPHYRTHAEIMLLPHEPQVIDLGQVLPGLGRDSQILNTQTEVLRSRMLVTQLVDHLGLMRDPEFNPALRVPGPLDRRVLENRVRAWLGLAPRIAPPPPPEQQRAGAINEVIRALEISISPETLVIDLGIATTDPQKSARIVNVLAGLYLDDQVALKMEETDRATAWLTERVLTLRARLEAAEAEARAVRAERDLSSPQDLEEMERRLSALRRLQEVNGADPARDAEIAALTDGVARASQDLVTVAQLEREAEATRLLYRNVLARLQETSMQTGGQSADARILSQAVVPLHPAYPKPVLLALIGLILGTGLGALVVLAREQFASRVRTPEEAQRLTGLPVLAALPQLPGGRDPADAVQRIPDGALAGAVRDLRNSLMLSGARRGAQVVCVTGSVAGEGASTTALLLAHTLAAWRKSVLLIEAVPGEIPLVSRFGMAERAGILSVLAGIVPLDQALWRPPGTRIDVLVGERVSAAGSDIYSTSRLETLLPDLRQRFDYIVIDTPPVLGRTEARLIAPLADAVVYAVRWRHTRRSAVRRGLARLSGFGVTVTGTALTRAHPRTAVGQAAGG